MVKNARNIHLQATRKRILDIQIKIKKNWIASKIMQSPSIVAVVARADTVVAT